MDMEMEMEMESHCVHETDAVRQELNYVLWAGSIALIKFSMRVQKINNNESVWMQMMPLARVLFAAQINKYFTGQCKQNKKIRK